VETERLVTEITNKGGKVVLIRINPDFPLADSIDETKVLSIMSGGLTAIKLIDSKLEPLLKGSTL